MKSSAPKVFLRIISIAVSILCWHITEFRFLSVHFQMIHFKYLSKHEFRKDKCPKLICTQVWGSKLMPGNAMDPLPFFVTCAFWGLLPTVWRNVYSFVPTLWFHRGWISKRIYLVAKRCKERRQKLQHLTVELYTQLILHVPHLKQFNTFHWRSRNVTTIDRYFHPTMLRAS